MKTSEKKTIVTLVTILFVISIILLSASITFSAIVQEFKTLDIQLTVANHLGFNTDADKLYLGTVPRGNTASRNVLIENKEYEKSVVRLKVFGELRGWITVSGNNFVLKKGESKIVEVKFSLIKPKPNGKVNYPKSWTVMDYQTKYLRKRKYWRKKGFWALGLYELDRSVEEIQTKEHEELEKMVLQREMYLIIWGWT